MYLSILGASAEGIMAKRQASLLSFRQIRHKRPRESEEKADDDQDQGSDDSDRQDVQVEESPEESEHESEHSCHDPSHMLSTLSPKILVISQPLKY